MSTMQRTITDWRPTTSRSHSSWLVDEEYEGRWVTIGVYVHSSLTSARQSLAHYRAKHPDKTYRIVENVYVSQPPIVVELSEPPR